MTSERKLSTDESLEILGLDKTAGEDAIKQAFKRISKACHPDTNGSKYLFQLVNNAYQTLTKTGKETQHTAAGTQDKKPTRYDLIYDKDFVCPFDDFMTAAYGMQAHVVHKGYVIPIDSDSLQIEYIRTKWPGKATCKLYTNFIQYMLNRPASITQNDITMVNMYPMSLEFRQTLNITTKTPKLKYYRLSVTMQKTGLRIQMQGRVKDATPDNPQEKKEFSWDPMFMSAKCILKFTTQQE